MIHQKNKEAGFTLVEILGAVAIFTFATSIFLGFFLNAFDYVKGSQNKTVGVHAARNAVTYLESRDFNLVEGLLPACGDSDFSNCYQTLTITDSQCNNADIKRVFSQDSGEAQTICEQFLHPKINNIYYSIELEITRYDINNPLITFKKGDETNFKNTIKNTFKGQDTSIEEKMRQNVLTVQASVNWKDDKNARERSSVTGYIVTETLR